MQVIKKGKSKTRKNYHTNNRPMKNIIAIFFFLSSITCIAQDEEIKKKIDSLSYANRAKADIVLRYFDSIRAEKVLYSISDKHYYVILKEGHCFKEYYINIDSAGNRIDQRTVKTSRKSKKILEKAFDLDSYHKEFITKANNPTVVQGNPTYFVVKDTESNRYGEFSLSAITVPIPIDKQVYNYLLTRLLRESTKSSKAP